MCVYVWMNITRSCFHYCRRQRENFRKRDVFHVFKVESENSSSQPLFSCHIFENMLPLYNSNRVCIMWWGEHERKLNFPHRLLDDMKILDRHTYIYWVKWKVHFKNGRRMKIYNLFSWWLLKHDTLEDVSIITLHPSYPNRYGFEDKHTQNGSLLS